MARGGLIVNRVHREGLHGHTVEQVAELLREDLGERLASRAWRRTSPTSTCSRAGTRATVERLGDELGESAPVVVPYLDEDIQDLAGLARIAAFLLG